MIELWYPHNMRSEIIQIVTCNNYDGSQHLLASYFHENLFHYL